MIRTRSLRSLAILSWLSCLTWAIPAVQAQDAETPPDADAAAADTAPAEGATEADAAVAEKETSGITEIPVQPSPQTGPSANAPRQPSNPTYNELLRALREAQAELKEVEEESAKEAEELGAAVALQTNKLSGLRDDLQSREKRLQEIQKELEKVDGQIADASDKRSRAEESMRVTSGELDSQLSTLEERFTGSLVTAEDPQLPEKVAAIQEGSQDELPERVQELLDLYIEILDYARTVSTFTTRIQLPSQGGKLDRADVLRLGLLGGYYHQPGGEVGYVLTDPEGNAGFKGESRGISPGQSGEIRAAIADPARGGSLPSDVTGGAGVAALQTQETWGRWFEAGGFAMWPLLAIFLTSLLLIIERSVVLTVKSLGIRRRTDKVLGLVRSGRADEAEELCRKMGGAVGSVLHAALVHRDKDRSVMEDAVQEALLHHAPSFQTRLGFIALCAAVAPLMGLFGTVTGMISTFKMVTLFGTSDPRFMAGGISEALITTETGLMIAIPSLLMRGILGALADSAIGRLEAGALSVVIEIVKAQEGDDDLKEAA